MSNLVAINYDPAAAVTKSTAALLALTALDTVNLRATFACPAAGKVLVRLAGVLHGATTYPAILLGVLDGATVRMRAAPMTGGGNLAATALQVVEATAVITGLTPGTTYNFDAAYGVETLVAATGIKYGGPNNALTNDAFGAFVMEVWTTS